MTLAYFGYPISCNPSFLNQLDFLSFDFERTWWSYFRNANASHALN